VRAISSLLQVSPDYVRDVIHAFEERGFDALDPKWRGGRPRTVGEQIRDRICLIARTSPADWGITVFVTWSLTELRDHLLVCGTVTAISRDNVAADPAGRRRVVADQHHLEGLHRPGLHHQDAPHPGSLRPPTHRRACGLCGRVRPIEISSLAKGKRGGRPRSRCGNARPTTATAA
jgi:hypothetical protein